MRRKLIIGLSIAAGVIAVAIVVIWLLTRPITEVQPPLADPTPTAATSLDAPVGVPTEDSSAAEVIRYYFDRWNAKDSAGMDACRVEEDRGLHSYDDLPLIESVTLTALNEKSGTDEDVGYEEGWYDGTGDRAFFVADFTIHYNDEGKEMYQRDTAENKEYQFWMIKLDNNTPWQIMMQGY